jgi:hypothetical protein
VIAPFCKRDELLTPVLCEERYRTKRDGYFEHDENLHSIQEHIPVKEESSLSLRSFRHYTAGPLRVCDLLFGSSRARMI